MLDVAGLLILLCLRRLKRVLSPVYVVVLFEVVSKEWKDKTILTFESIQTR